MPQQAEAIRDFLGYSVPLLTLSLTVPLPYSEPFLTFALILQLLALLTWRRGSFSRIGVTIPTIVAVSLGATFVFPVVYVLTIIHSPYIIPVCFWTLALRLGVAKLESGYGILVQLLSLSYVLFLSGAITLIVLVLASLREKDILNGLTNLKLAISFTVLTSGIGVLIYLIAITYLRYLLTLT